MRTTVLRRIDETLADEMDAIRDAVQTAFGEVVIRKSDILRMVIRRGLDELKRDIQNGRIR